MPASSEIRQQFIDFFVKKHGHAFVPSSPVVPHDDPTLLFANAGMNQFKPYFLGTETPKARRVANTQKCIRAGGKHNDLDDVGKDTYHHTFFEMLGNWSFGDYFKKEAITWAWELLTQVWKLDPARLHVTVFEGDPDNGIPRDDEAAEIWMAVGVAENHIHLGNRKDNFWMMGDTGPCGPCTEIHYDKTPDKSGAKLVNGSSDQCIEIWNNVFIQFNAEIPSEGVAALGKWDASSEDERKKSGFKDRETVIAKHRKFIPLPAKHVDTGMGFERICAVLNNVPSNYDTDVFAPLFAAIQTATGARPYGGKLDDLTDTAYRVIGDHIRTLTFALTDGSVPGAKGRGAVLRSVLRRASRYGWQVFGKKEPFLFTLVDAVVANFGGAFPELKLNPAKVRATIKEEEVSFLRTLENGLLIFRVNAAHAVMEAMLPLLVAKHGTFTYGGADFTVPDEQDLATQKSDYPLAGARWIIRNAQKEALEDIVLPNTKRDFDAFIEQRTTSRPVLSGAFAFNLHTTYGLDIGITSQMAGEAGLFIDRALYDKLFEQFQAESGKNRNKTVISTIQGSLPKTDDAAKYGLGWSSGFSPSSSSKNQDGLKPELQRSKVVGWVEDNKVVSDGTLAAGKYAALLLDRTSFYAEQGGQVGDAGTLTTESGAEFEVEDTNRLGDAVLHLGTLQQGTLAVGDTVQLSVAPKRTDIQRNHTATHLMNLGLRTTLGGHVEQKGSLVDAEKTRFDFSHDKPLTDDEVRAVEAFVNEHIGRELAVTAVTVPLAEAKQIPGVRAVFGEKYPDPVRVVLIGPDTPAAATPEDSVEFCGGTHVRNTAGIGTFKIVSQDGVSKGVRRVTAVTGRVAADVLAKQSRTLGELADRFQCLPEQLVNRVDDLQSEVKKLKAAVAKTQAAELTTTVDALIAEAKEVAGAKVVVGQLPGETTVDGARTQVDRVRQKHPSAFIVFAWSADDGKVPVLAALTKDLIAKGLKAGDIVKQVAAVVGGTGGGKPDLAQAGGKDASKIGDALAKARELAAGIK